MLNFVGGELFATGAIKYLYKPACENETTSRIMLLVHIETIETLAIFDTGAPYVICPPQIARLLNLDLKNALEKIPMVIRGSKIQGFLTRLSIKFPATEGDGLIVDATVFIPESDEYWGNFPSFIGLTGCMERMRFAIDPGEDKFYFGSLANPQFVDD